MTIQYPPISKILTVKSKFPYLSLILTSASFAYSIFFLILFSIGGRSSHSDHHVVFGFTSNILLGIIIFEFLALTGLYLGYLVEKQYVEIGFIEIICEENVIKIESKDTKYNYKLEDITRIIFDQSAIKGEPNFYSVNSSGTKNHLEINLNGGDSLNFEILVSSKKLEEDLKGIIYYHTVNFRK